MIGEHGAEPIDKSNMPQKSIRLPASDWTTLDKILKEKPWLRGYADAIREIIEERG